MTEAEREKIKLRANYLNGVALLFLGLGRPRTFVCHSNLSRLEEHTYRNSLAAGRWNVELGDTPTSSAAAE